MLLFHIKVPRNYFGLSIFWGHRYAGPGLCDVQDDMHPLTVLRRYWIYHPHLYLKCCLFWSMAEVFNVLWFLKNCFRPLFSWLRMTLGWLQPLCRDSLAWFSGLRGSCAIKYLIDLQHGGSVSFGIVASQQKVTGFFWASLYLCQACQPCLRGFTAGCSGFLPHSISQ